MFNKTQNNKEHLLKQSATSLNLFHLKVKNKGKLKSNNLKKNKRMNLRKLLSNPLQLLLKTNQ